MFREGNGNPLQYSCLENPMDGGGWWAAVHGVAQSQTRLKRLSKQQQCVYVNSKLLIYPSPTPFPLSQLLSFSVSDSLFFKLTLLNVILSLEIFNLYTWSLVVLLKKKFLYS